MFILCCEIDKNLALEFKYNLFEVNKHVNNQGYDIQIDFQF